MIYSDGNLIVKIIVGSDHTIDWAYPPDFFHQSRQQQHIGPNWRINVIDKAGAGQSINLMVGEGFYITILLL